MLLQFWQFYGNYLDAIRIINLSDTNFFQLFNFLVADVPIASRLFIILEICGNRKFIFLFYSQKVQLYKNMSEKNIFSGHTKHNFSTFNDDNAGRNKEIKIKEENIYLSSLPTKSTPIFWFTFQ